MYRSHKRNSATDMNKLLRSDSAYRLTEGSDDDYIDHTRLRARLKKTGHQQQPSIETIDSHMVEL